MRKSLTLVLAMSAALLLPNLPSAHASFPGNDGLIIYSDEGDLWVVNADGTGRKQLTSGPTDDGMVSWSADGKKVVFRRDGRIATMKANGRKIRDTGVEGNDPRWYPDGTRIVFWDGFGVWTMRPNGTGLRLLYESFFAENFAHVFRNPSYSVDGYLAVSEFEHELEGSFEDIVVESPPPSNDCGISPDKAEWSPDGRKLAILGFGGLICLTDGITGGTLFLDVFAFDLSWSPSGDRVVLGDGRLADLEGNVIGEDLFDILGQDVEWQPRCTVEGTPGDDVLTGTDGDDVICGLGGDDTLSGLGGADVLYGGSGDDYLDAGPGPDLIYGGFNADRLFGGGGDDFVNAGPGADIRCNGGSGTDRAEGCEVSAEIP
jgi:hypothetical protein